ncbi:MAG: hypothetical protein K2K56_11120 [Lachnospiraceae bacterium]|nr:hypothetical protein [Lachnospiraceae bacterium]
MADLEERVNLLEQQVSAIIKLLGEIVETYNPNFDYTNIQEDSQQTSKNNRPKSVGDV